MTALIAQDKENYVMHVKLVMLHQVYICLVIHLDQRNAHHGCLTEQTPCEPDSYLRFFAYCLVPIISLINQECYVNAAVIPADNISDPVSRSL